VGSEVFALEVPESCRLCGARGRVTLEQTIQQTRIVLRWSCQACHRTWPVTLAHDRTERRRGVADRRRSTRA